MKTKEVKGTIADAVSFVVGELQSLAEEVREVVDNASGTPRENTQRIQTLSETADLIEVDDPDIEDGLGKIEVTWHVMLPKSRRRGLSRGSRRDNAMMALDAVIQLLQDADEISDEAQSLIDDLERIKDQAESAEFPGMFG